MAKAWAFGEGGDDNQPFDPIAEDIVNRYLPLRRALRCGALPRQVHDVDVYDGCLIKHLKKLMMPCLFSVCMLSSAAERSRGGTAVRSCKLDCSASGGGRRVSICAAGVRVPSGGRGAGWLLPR